MALGTSTSDTPNVRDIEGDYLKATIAEYEALETAGLKSRAAEVAAHLKVLGHDVKGKAAKPEVVETAAATDEVETAAETEAPKPRRTTKARKPEADDEE